MNSNRIVAIKEWMGVASGAVLAVCAVVMTGLFAWREIAGTRGGAGESPFTPQPDWREYTEEGQWLGAPDAKAVLVEFGDYQCPACRVLHERLRATRARFGREVAVVYRHLPLTRSHPLAEAAALASECAARQGRFEPMHDLLYQYQDSIGRWPWSRFADSASVSDPHAFSACLQDSVAVHAVQRDRQAATRLGTVHTPTVLVSGVRFRGAIDQATLDSLVSAAIDRSSSRR